MKNTLLYLSNQKDIKRLFKKSSYYQKTLLKLLNDMGPRNILTLHFEEYTEYLSEQFFDFMQKQEDVYRSGLQILDWYDADENEEDDMIVVATLIEKIPNMGGLTRTCKTMGMKGLVVPNLTLVKT